MQPGCPGNNKSVGFNGDDDDDDYFKKITQRGENKSWECLLTSSRRQKSDKDTYEPRKCPRFATSRT